MCKKFLPRQVAQRFLFCLFLLKTVSKFVKKYFYCMICQLKNVKKEYVLGGQTFTALQPTNLSIEEKELLLIIGPSGSGKTTLLSLIGCVIYPTSGELFVQNQLINDLTADEMAALRLHTIGFVFQNFNLLAPLSVYENVKIPLDLLKQDETDSAKKIQSSLELLGMWEKRHSLPKQLSGGQQQRVAIARALVTEPPILLCDEPTASLDKESAITVMKTLRQLADSGKAVAVVTHDPRLKEYADRIVQVENGLVTPFGKNTL